MDQPFSVPKCVRIARMSQKSYKLLCKMFAAAPGRTKDELEPIQGKKFVGYASGNFSDFDRHKQKGSTASNYNAVDESDEIHRVMIWKWNNYRKCLGNAIGEASCRHMMSSHAIVCYKHGGFPAT